MNNKNLAFSKKVQLLDCTLRDGGHVNGAKFGKVTICNVAKKLTEAKLDFVELGFLKNGVFDDSLSTCTDVTEMYANLPSDKDNTMYSMMIRPDWYDIKQLSECDGRIEFLRFAFYYKDFELMKMQGEEVRKKGYRFICNPVNIMGYSKNELVEIVKRVNDVHPEQLTMVDTYGAMGLSDLHRIYSVVEKYLDSDINLGLHLHENRALSFGLMQEFLRLTIATERSVAIDGSLMGMGRIPGNLPIELAAEYLNEEANAKYNMDAIYDVIGESIFPIREKFIWGYSPAYNLTGKLNIHRSYAEFLLNKSELQLGDINRILKIVDTDKGKMFNEDYINDLYREYMEKKYGH